MTALNTRDAAAIVANIIKDGAKDAFINASEAERTEIVLAYVQAQIKKTELMQTLYLTDSKFKAGFRSTVLGLCQKVAK